MLIVQTSSKESVVWQENEGVVSNNQYIHISWCYLIFSVSSAIILTLQEHKLCLKMPAVEKCYFRMLRLQPLKTYIHGQRC